MVTVVDVGMIHFSTSVLRNYKHLTTVVLSLFTVWMVRKNARSVLEVLGRDEKNRGQGEILTLERRDLRQSVGARHRGYEYVPVSV
jgi:hypothetical protein